MNCVELLQLCKRTGDCLEFYAKCRHTVEPTAAVTLAPGERRVVDSYVVEKTIDGKIVVYELR